MDPIFVQNVFRESMYLVTYLVALIIMPSLVVGLIVSIFQAATQINEQTLSFLPRLLMTFATITFAGPWMVQKLVDFVDTLFKSIPYMIY
jgi:flagellar biosynthetic protein FliQ